jgi:hypothetical protein
MKFWFFRFMFYVFSEEEVKHIKETFDIFSAEELSGLIRPE